MAEYTGENRRKRSWGFWLLLIGFPATAVASYTAAPNVPEPVEPDPIVFPTYASNFDSIDSRFDELAARVPEVREVIVFRDTGRTLPPRIDTIPVPYPVPGPVRIDSVPYPVPGPVSIVQIPAAQHRSHLPTDIAIGLSGTLLGIVARSVFDGGTQCTFVVEDDDDDDHDDDYGR